MVRKSFKTCIAAIAAANSALGESLHVITAADGLGQSVSDSVSVNIVLRIPKGHVKIVPNVIIDHPRGRFPANDGRTILFQGTDDILKVIRR